MSGASIFADPLTDRLAAFVRNIGIDVRAATLPQKTVQFYGKAVEPRRAVETGAEPYPHMLRWLR
jgi:hypothetical protein